jgi:NAD(P)-dependent dehydrogenase (short-subunit alcohol dehydrogenase family)
VIDIGYYTALNMAQRNARVILACRNVESAQKAANDIQLKTGNKNVVVEQVEMSRLESVRRFADKINRNEARLDILINNAATAGIFHSTINVKL